MQPVSPLDIELQSLYRSPYRSREPEYDAPSALDATSAFQGLRTVQPLASPMVESSSFVGQPVVEPMIVGGTSGLDQPYLSPQPILPPVAEDTPTAQPMFAAPWEDQSPVAPVPFNNFQDDMPVRPQLRNNAPSRTPSSGPYKNKNNSTKYTASYRTNNPFNIKKPSVRGHFWDGQETGYDKNIPGKHVIFDNPAIGAAGGIENLAYWGRNGGSLKDILRKFTPVSDKFAARVGEPNRPDKISSSVAREMRARGYSFNENQPFNQRLHNRAFLVDFMQSWAKHESPVVWDPRMYEDAADIFLAQGHKYER